MGDLLRRLCTTLLLGPWLDASERKSVRADLEDLSRRYGARGSLLGPRGYFWLQLVRYPVHLVRVERLRLPPGGTALARTTEPLRQEMSLAGRRLLGAPTSTAVTVGALAVAMATASVTLLVLHRMTRQPLPFPDDHRLVIAYEAQETPDGREIELLLPEASIRSIREGVPGVQAVAGMYPTVKALRYGERAAPARVTAVTDGFFTVLGVAPRMGRLLSEQGPGDPAEREVLVSHRLSEQRRAADPQTPVLGSIIRLDGVPHRIVGILPPVMTLPGGTDAWTRLHPDDIRGMKRYLLPVLRLRPSADLVTTAEEIAALRQDDPGAWGELRIRPLRDYILAVSPVRIRLSLLAALTLLVMAVVNVIGLTLGKLRHDANTVRLLMALGAGRSRLAVRYGAEVTLLMSLSAAGAVLLGPWLVGSVKGLLSSEYLGVGLLEEVSAAKAAGLTLVLAVSCAAVKLVAIGVWTVGYLRRADLPALARNDRREPRLTNGLIAVQVSAVVTLLAGAFALADAARASWSPGLGVDADRVLSITIVTDEEGVRGTGVPELVRRAEQRLAALPGVSAVTVTSSNPFRSEVFLVRYVSPDSSGVTGPVVLTNRRSVGRGYFATLGLPVTEGRGFTEAEVAGPSDAAVVSEPLARRLWPGGSAVGRRIRWAPAAAPPQSLRVVGVVPEVEQEGDMVGSVFRPYASDPALSVGSTLEFLVLHDGSPDLISRRAREALHGSDLGMAVGDTESLASVIAFTHRLDTFPFAALAGFSILASLLALGGAYGMVAASLQRRSRELAVRRALGAPARSLLSLVYGRVFSWTVAGVTAGLGGGALARGPGGGFFALPKDAAHVPLVVLVGILALGAIVVLVPFLESKVLDPCIVLSEE